MHGQKRSSYPENLLVNYVCNHFWVTLLTVQVCYCAVNLMMTAMNHCNVFFPSRVYYWSLLYILRWN